MMQYRRTIRARGRHPTWAVLAGRMVAVLTVATLWTANDRSAVAQILPKAKNEASAPAPDPFGRDSPRGLVSGLVGALGGDDQIRPAVYFDLTGFAPLRRERAGAAYVRRMKVLLDRGGVLSGPLSLSDQPTGRLNDGLPPDQERIGSLPMAGGKMLPIIAVAIAENGKPVWTVSRQTLSSMPAATAQAAWRANVPPILTRGVLGAPLIDWLVLLAVGGLIYAFVRLAFAASLYVLGRFKQDRDVGHIWRLVDAGAAPLSLVLTVAFFLSAASTIGVSIIARVLVGQFIGAVFVVAFLWLLWRVVDVGAEIVIERMDRHERRRAKSAILFARRSAKLLLIAVAIIAVLATIGINVTAGLAALGIGGIALALGAQKTIENVVGSVSVIADELVRVGDFVRVGDVTGTVEDIGIRSTRIRTSERTRVSIPNGNLAAMQVENYAMRDRFLFNPTLALASNLDADGVERALQAIREALAAADSLSGDARANFKGFAGSALEIETFGYFATGDATEAAALKERLLMDIMRRVTASGGGFFSPVAACVPS